ncbi:RecT family recombinase [Pseudochrobactrum sp. MP213Fo]|uniref:RecT family recombinase n=1 Tax=Pseudochrobactrum sp. MP213Fo TaxID=3022250 RepID=UPI003BA14A5C
MNQIEPAQKRSLVDSMASRYDMEPAAFVSAIKATVIKGDCSNEQFAAFLMVAKEYKLNPLTKEIYAFPDRGGIQPIVSIDGWMNLINSHPQFDGMEFQDTTSEDGKLYSVECRIYRKDRTRPVSVIEYMSECFRPTEPWKKWPNRMLRHKAAIQAARYAFGFSGIMEPDEYDRMKDVSPRPATVIADPLCDDPINVQETVTVDGEVIDETPECNDQKTMAAESPSAATVEGDEQSPSSTTLETQSSAMHLTGTDKASLKELIIRLKSAIGDDPDIIKTTAHSFNAAGFELSDYAKSKARTITKHFINVCTGELEATDAIALACGIAQIDEAEVVP